MSQENLACSPNAKRLTDNLSRKVNYFSFGSNRTEEKVAPHFYVPRLRVEENSTKNRRIVTARHIPATCEGTQSSGIPKTSDRLFFEAATVWDWGGQPASYSGKEYSRLFKEIMGGLRLVPRSANHSCRDRRICFRHKGSFTSPKSNRTCIASTHTHTGGWVEGRGLGIRIFFILCDRCNPRAALAFSCYRDLANKF